MPQEMLSFAMVENDISKIYWRHLFKKSQATFYDWKINEDNKNYIIFTIF